MKWIKRTVVADKLGVSYNYLRTELEGSEGFPKVHKLSPKVYVYVESEIEDWMNKVMKTEAECVN